MQMQQAAETPVMIRNMVEYTLLYFPRKTADRIREAGSPEDLGAELASRSLSEHSHLLVAPADKKD